MVNTFSSLETDIFNFIMFCRASIKFSNGSTNMWLYITKANSPPNDTLLPRTNIADTNMIIAMVNM